jgi:hypothetical protein
MSSNTSNIDNPLELVQKTYNIPAKTTTTTTNNEENISQRRPSFAKISTHQPSRKNSIHDIHQITKDDFYKVEYIIISILRRLYFCFSFKDIYGYSRKSFTFKSFIRNNQFCSNNSR